MVERTCLRGGWAFSDALGLSLPFLWSSPVHPRWMGMNMDLALRAHPKHQTLLGPAQPSCGCSVISLGGLMTPPAGLSVSLFPPSLSRLSLAPGT